MKKIALVLSLASFGLLSACVNEHYYQPPVQTTVYQSAPVHTPRKASPSVHNEGASDFRAVERPATYSQ